MRYQQNEHEGNELVPFVLVLEEIKVAGGGHRERAEASCEVVELGTPGSSPSRRAQRDSKQTRAQKNAPDDGFKRLQGNPFLGTRPRLLDEAMSDMKQHVGPLLEQLQPAGYAPGEKTWIGPAEKRSQQFLQGQARAGCENEEGPQVARDDECRRHHGQITQPHGPRAMGPAKHQRHVGGRKQECGGLP
jgi:hypothetical protein